MKLRNGFSGIFYKPFVQVLNVSSLNHSLITGTTSFSITSADHCTTQISV